MYAGKTMWWLASGLASAYANAGLCFSETQEQQMVVVSIGTVLEGFTVTGPFADKEAADHHMISDKELNGLCYEVMELLKPKKTE